MTVTPLVSIVITTFGPPDSLHDCVLSAMDQDYPNFEVIVVDDNGAGTRNQKKAEEIITSFSDSSVPVYYLKHTKNKNGSAARNTGIEFAHGEYIALLDDDDLFYPRKISLQMDALRDVEGPGKFSYCSFRVIKGTRVRNIAIAPETGDISKTILLKQMEIPSSALLMTKACHTAVGGFDESFNRHQDWEFLIRAGHVCNHAAVEDICFDKKACMRNTPRDPEVFIGHRRHYLEKMRHFISGYPVKIRNHIRMIHVGDIAIQHFRTGNFSGGLKYIFKSGQPLRCKLYIMRKVILHLGYKIREVCSPPSRGTVFVPERSSIGKNSIGQ